MTPSEEEQALELLLPQLERFLARAVRSDEIDRAAAIPEAVVRGAADLGLFGLTIPEEHGGSGLSLASTCRVVEAIARADRSVAIMVGLHAGLGTRGVVRHANQELARVWLPRLASGEWIGAFAATEPCAGSDLSAIRTTGVPHANGLRIDGEKVYVTNGGFASLLTVLVRTPGLGGQRGTSLVCVPRDAPGVEIGREEDKLGIRGSSTVSVRFDGVVVPWDHVLGAPGAGIDMTHELLTWGRTIMSAGCAGTARSALRAAVAHVEARSQFGRPLSSFGATRVHLAWMTARVRAIDAAVRRVGELELQRRPIEVASAIAKVFASESAFAVCDRALQLHGALGFLETTGVARMLRDCRITRIFEGANDVLLLRIGAARIAASPGFETPGPDAPREARDLERRLDAAVRDTKARLGIGVMKHQLVLQMIAAASSALHVACCLGQDALDRHALEELVREGELALDRVTRADREEDAASALVANA